MANVTGDSVKEVSNQLTAIWNNFAKGGKQLEYYVDVITALGAATASSTSEISEGLEKFAAVAETVGLSYEYATTALATVTAETRQSADVVGTAFKTLFARIQDLELGKTLEDGTTLGKYAQALQTIGVNVKTSTGEVKDMNTILDEMGAKWKQIDDATKIATAQAVAGTRQYAQLMALMENWDTFQTNLVTAQNSEGELDRQAQIYAESWEGARNRVKAALEEIYGALLDDKAFIKMTDGLAGIVKYIGDLVRNMGGLKGVLPMITGLMLQFAGPQIYNGLHKIVVDITNVIPNFKAWSNEIKQARGFLGKTGALLSPVTIGETRAEGLRAEAITEAQKAYSDDKTLVGAANRFNVGQTVDMQQRLVAINKNITEEQRQQLTLMIDRQKIVGQELVDTAKKIDQQKEENKLLELAAEQEQKRNEVQTRAEAQKRQEQIEKQQQREEKKWIDEQGARKDRQDAFNTDVKNLSSLSTVLNQYQNTGGSAQVLSDYNHRQAISALVNNNIVQRGLNNVGWDQDTINSLQTAIQNPAVSGTEERQNQINLIKKFKNSLDTDLGQFLDKYINNVSTSIKKAIDDTSDYEGEAEGYVAAIQEGRLDTYNTTWAGDLVNGSYYDETATFSPSEIQPVDNTQLNAFNTQVDLYKQLGDFASFNGDENNIDILTAKLQEYKEALESAGVSSEKLNITTENLDEAHEQFAEVQDEVIRRMKVSRTDIEKNATSVKREVKATLDSVDGKVAAAKEQQKYNKIQNESNKLTKSYQKNIQDALKSNKTTGQSFASVTSGIVQFGNGLQMTISLFKTLSDTSVPAWQRLITVFTMGIPAFTQTLNGIKQIGAGAAGLAANIYKTIAAKQLESAVNDNNYKEIAAQLIQNKALSASEKEELQDTNNLTASKVREVLMSHGLTIAKKGEAVAHDENAKNIIKEETVAWPLLAVTLLIVAAIAAVVAIIALITAAVQAHDKALKKDQVALEEANEALNKQKESLDNAKAAWDDLQNTISKYDSALEAINNLTVSTEAYNQAIQDLNQSVMDLIAQYPELEKFTSFENGHLSITQEGIDLAREKAQQDIVEAQARVHAAQAGQQQAQTRADLTAWMQNNVDKNAVYDFNSDSYQSQSFFDSFWGGFIEGISGAYIFGAEQVKNRADREAYQAGQVIKQLEEAIKNNATDNELDEMAKSLSDNAEQRKKLISTLRKQEAQTSAMQFAFANDITSQSEVFAKIQQTDSRTAAHIQNALASGIIEKRRNALKEQYRSGYSNQEIDNKKAEIAKAILVNQYGEDPDKIETASNGEDFYGEHYYIGHSGGEGYTVWYREKTTDKWSKDKSHSDNELSWREAAVKYLVNQEDSDYEDVQWKLAEKSENLTSTLEKLGLNDESVDKIIDNLLQEDGTINFGNLSPREAEIFANAWSSNPELRASLARYSNNKTADAITEAINHINDDRTKLIGREQDEAAQNAWKRKQTNRDAILSAAGLTKADFKNIETTFDEFKDLSDEAATVAIHAYGNAKSLGELWEAQGAILLNNTEDTIEYQQALTAVQTELEKIFGVSWTNEMIEEAGGWDTLSKAATGSADAIKAFQKVAAENWLKNRGLDTATEKAFLNFSNAIEQGKNPQEALDNLNSLVGKKINIKDLETYLDLYNIAYELDKDGNQIVSIAKVDTERIQKVLQGIRDKALEKEYDHYYSINQKIQETEKSLDRLSKAKDKAYGVNRLRLMEQEEHILEQQIAEQEELIDIANKQAQLQKDKMLKTIGSGVDVKFTSNGRIANYEAIMEAVGPTRYEEVADAIDKYVEELDRISDAEEKIRDLQDDILTSTYERYTYEIEIKTTANENDAKRIEYFLGKVEDDIYKVAEAAQYLEEQYDNIINSFDIQGESYSNLQDLYQQGEISQSDYIDGLQEQYDKTIENLEALNEFDNKMKEYYSETLSQAIEEIDKYIDRIEKSTDLLEHYQNLLKLTGHEFDYAKQLMLLDGFIDAERISVQKLADEVAFLESERVRVAQELAVADTDAAREQYQKMLDDIDEQLSEKRSDWAEASEQLIERLHERFNTYLTSTFKEIEDKLTNGLGLDQLQQRMANLKTLADIYLDDTNKVYETNKMINQINQAIAKTDNKAAKDRYKGFIDDIKALQNKGQLTKTELELAQSRYKVLQAQIALEEAQNAKSMVRLRRDNQGNFGYVYTASDNQISNAEQAVEDAENAYYNKRTTVVQNGIDKLLKLHSDYLQKIQDLWKKRQDGEIESDEELQRQLAELEQQYADEREGIMIGLQVAIGDVNTPDSIIGLLGEGWSSLLAKTEEVTQGMDDEVQAHMPEIQDEFNKTAEEANLLASSFIGSGDGGLKSAIKKVTDEADLLAKRLGSKDDKNTVIGKMADATAVADRLTSAWLGQQSAIQGLRIEYEKYLLSLGQKINDENNNIPTVIEGYKTINDSLTGQKDTYYKVNGQYYDPEDLTITKYNAESPANNVDHLAAIHNNAVSFSEEELNNIQKSYDNSYNNAKAMINQLNHTSNIYQTTVDKEKYEQSQLLPQAIINASQLAQRLGIRDLKELQDNDELSLSDKQLINKYEAWGQVNLPTPSDAAFIKLAQALKADDDNWFNINELQLNGNTYEKGRDRKNGIAWWSDIHTLLYPRGKEGEIFSDKVKLSRVFKSDGDIWISFDNPAYTGDNLRTFKAKDVLKSNIFKQINNLFDDQFSSQFDTGGYTGQWGPSGKLAMLHQKEIVLNADDTKNFLQAIDILRSIVSVIDLGAMQAMSGSMVSSSINSANNSLNQNVTIHAEFPNAVNHSEIEQAFDNLVNKASQYANRY